MPETTDSPIGQDVRVLRCEAREHGDNSGCVCHLIGGIERIARRYDTPFAGTPSYHLLGRPQRVRLSEVEIVQKYIFTDAPTTAAPLPRDATPGQAFAAMRVLYERRPQRDFTPADWRAWETEKTVLLEQVWRAATNAG